MGLLLPDTTSGQDQVFKHGLVLALLVQTHEPKILWTTWIPATFNAEVGNDDIIWQLLAPTLAAGTYYYASRFRLNGGHQCYGGTNDNFGMQQVMIASLDTNA